jgi:UTP--glucose-1-phosphate uridylyltransferase
VIEKDSNNNFVQIVEKPTPEDAPSNLINVSKYVLNSTALREVKAYARGERSGEYYITDPINDYVKNGGTVSVVPARGEYLDGGSVEGWLHANNVVVKSTT